MPDKTWKSIERKLARMFGAERYQDTHGPDFISDPYNLIVSVKHGKQAVLNKKIKTWWDEALYYREKYGGWGKEHFEYPVLMMHEPNMKLDNTWVLMRASDLKELLDN